MAGSLNKVQVIGNLARDPEIRYTGDNRAIANLTVVSNETWKDKDGKKQEKAEFHRIVIFGPLAEVAEKWLVKGSSAYFEGKLQTRKWQDKDGNDKYTTEIVIDIKGQMQMLGKQGDSDSTNDTKPVVEDDDPFGDSIPF